MVLATPNIELRGAPADLLASVRNYRGPKRIRETLICGPGGTGKSFGILLAIYLLANDFPGLRILLIRKTWESTKKSIIVEFEKILRAYQEACVYSQDANNRKTYKLRCGSRVEVGGLDDAQKLYSTEWDIIYYEELTEELDPGPWEEFRRGMRAFTNPNFREILLLASCNPRDKSHWLYHRTHDDGAPMEYRESWHKDNPKWWSSATNDWTEEGRAYIENLQTMTGVRYRRLYKGEWCTAEGAVWDEFQEETHITDAVLMKRSGIISVKPPWSKESVTMQWCFGGMDWGFSDACVFQVWGVDHDRRMWRLAEVYRQKMSLDWWTDRCAEFFHEFNLQAVVVDPSRPEAIEAFNRRIAYENGYSVPGFALGADNKRGTANDFGGIEAVRSQMTMRPDGRPGMLFLRNALRYGVDPELKALHKPTCTEEEVPAYIYLVTKDGRPNRDATDPRCVDHGCDTTRYCTVYARARDMRVPIERPKYRAGTLGSLLRLDGREIPWPTQR